jgi:hypothetical protein
MRRFQEKGLPSAYVVRVTSKLYKGWKKAVKRAQDWAEDSLE